MSFAVAIDFDGVLSDADGEPQPGALEMVTRLHKAGVTLFVHSSRATFGAGFQHITAWIEHHGFPPMMVVPKPVADVYLDDRALTHVDWSTSYAAIVRQKGREG